MAQEFSPRQMEALLQYAARRMNTTPQALKEAFAQGGLDGLMAKAQGSMTPEEAQKAQQITQGRDAASLLQDPQVAALLKKLTEGL
ncbi:MAG: hypothetical protein E7541_04450 [Ruminococcaceae bacterium]|nr:hypothetical protein [Oscillospiraceae bacterium]